MAFVNINGRFAEQGQAVLQADNRAFRYGIGLFETMLMSGGEVQLWPYHSRRLFEGMQQLGFELPRMFTADMLQEELLRTAAKNSLSAMCRLRLQVFAGNGGIHDGGRFAPEFLVECFPIPETLPDYNENGLVTGIAEGLAKTADSLANLKSANALLYMMAARQAKQNKWNDALIVNSDGHIIETSIANVFWVKGKQIFTPPLSEGCVAGVMRAFLLDELAKKGVSVVQKPLTVAALTEADELFVSNAIRRIKWVGSMGDKTFDHAESQRISSIIF